MNRNEQELLLERQRLQDAIKRKTEAAMTPLSEMTDELSLYDQHSGDLGSETFEREKDAGLQEMLEARLTQVNDALNRLSDGRYGICERCGQPIDPRRLERLPSASLCISCARRDKDRFVRPPEEEILNMHEIDAKGDQFEVAGYDLFDEYGIGADSVTD
ncbi:MAG: TraR/DksA C4-type zinc finger protein [Syntrophomonadales bacterium]